MKKYLPARMFFASVLFFMAISGCKKTEKVHADTAIILSGANNGINTCGWILRVNESASATSPQNSFKPVNLDEQFQADSMQVKITYTIPDAPAIRCGSNEDDVPGYTQINILSVQKVQYKSLLGM